MAQFEVFTKEVEVNGDKYRIRPLSGRFLPKLYTVLSGMDVGKDGDEHDILKQIDEETVEKMHTVVLESIKKSYPNENEEKLDDWVSQNLMELFNVVVEVNVQQHMDEEDVKGD